VRDEVTSSHSHPRNNRIVRSGPNGSRCLVGCSHASGSTSDKLDLPYSSSSDSYGNMFVTDYDNNRIQKFILPQIHLISAIITYQKNNLIKRVELR
jgi:hypothetical protein